MKYALLTLALVSCSPWYNLKDTDCWKPNSCVETYPVTSEVVKLEFTRDHNGQNNGIYLIDRETGIKYQLMRRNHGNENLELKVADEKNDLDLSFFR